MTATWFHEFCAWMDDPAPDYPLLSSYVQPALPGGQPMPMTPTDLRSQIPNANIPQPWTPASRLDEALDRLTKTASAFEFILQTLVDRLTPLCRPEPPATAKQPGEVQRASSTVVARLHELDQRYQAIGRVL